MTRLPEHAPGTEIVDLVLSIPPATRRENGLLIHTAGGSLDGVHGRRLVAGVAVTLLVSTPGTAPTDVVRVSLGQLDEQAAGASNFAAASADGRIVAFMSPAANLVPDDTNLKVKDEDGFAVPMDVFVRDLSLCTTERVSVTSKEEQAEGDSLFPVVSADGRFVAFETDAPNLASAPVGYGAARPRRVYVRDRAAGTTELVTVAMDGGPSSGNSASLSADGRYVGFISDAQDLSASTPQETRLWWGYVYDRTLGVTERLFGSLGGIDPIWEVELSGDGNWVALRAARVDLAPDAVGSGVYLHNRVTGETREIPNPLGGFVLSGLQISYDGCVVLFHVEDRETLGTSLANTLYDCETGESEVLFRGSQWAGLSRNGRYVAFVSHTWVMGDGEDGLGWHLYLWDRELRTASRVLDGVSPYGRTWSPSPPTVSDDGKVVTFASWQDDLVPDDTNESIDVFAASDAEPSLSCVVAGALREGSCTEAPSRSVVRALERAHRRVATLEGLHEASAGRMHRARRRGARALERAGKRIRRWEHRSGEVCAPAVNGAVQSALAGVKAMGRSE